MKDPFKTKTNSQLRSKKVYITYRIRPVNANWEISSPFHKVQAKSVEACWIAIRAMEDLDPDVIEASRFSRPRQKKELPIKKPSKRSAKKVPKKKK